MKLSKVSLLFIFFISILTAQNKQITIDQLWDGTFSTKGLYSLHSMSNGKQYAVLNKDGNSTTIDIYDYKTLKKSNTLLNSEEIDGIKGFSDYTLSEDEQKILLATEVEYIFRRSKIGVYYVYDLKSKTLEKISDKKIIEPSFSADGSKVAYGFENNLYIKNLSDGETLQITEDGKKNEIINGITDWVYEEEFSFVKAYEWNADGSKIGFLQFDETEVPEFSMDKYGIELYQVQEVFKYPKAGEKNSEVSLHIYDLESRKIEDIQFKKSYTDFYIPRIKWTNDPKILSVQVLNRHQNNLDLWMVNASDSSSQQVLSETDKAYIDVTDNLTFLKDNSFIWTSEQDGYNHIYHYSKDGKLLNQITKGDWEVTNYYGFDEDAKRIYYQSVENGSINRDIYSIALNGNKKIRLSTEEGTNDASFSNDFSYYINTFSNASTPTTYTLNDSKDGKQLKVIEDNQGIKNKLTDFEIPEKEFSTIKVNGNDLNMWMIKPKDFDDSKVYPLLMFQYSGPGSQQVANTWNSTNDYWFYMLADKGYIIATVDGRGTGFKGADFKKVTQNELGKYEVEDQIEAAKTLGERSYIDKERIGIWGWSYGGFMSSNAIFKGNDVFKMAIAVAPVTSWRFYDSVYTERYMTTPQENPSGYDENSPLSHVDKLKGDFLLIHGSADDNVHVQNSMRLIEALIQADKDFDWLIFPDKSHGISGGNTRNFLYNKMTNFLDEKLGDKIQDSRLNTHKGQR
ncbi:dipeptidyl-peptidase-4 [Flavobacteriaceae bacterium MAR_2010_188]|nr:dipeptidyl-peptidase-4 [Flavobacteriaceae bacterium MAR_2010_188]